MMRKLCVLYTLVLFFTCTTYAQIISPVKWKYEVKKVEQGTYDVYFTASIEAPWHIYSQFLADGGPIPTKIVFNKNPVLTIRGKAKEIGTPVTKHEEVFNMDVTYFPKKASFVQRVQKKVTVKTTLSGYITYMVCKEGECLPVATEHFSIPVE